MIDIKKTEALGISVNNNLPPVEVYFEGKLDPLVQSELEYFYGGNVKFISGGLSSENAFIKGTDEAKIIEERTKRRGLLAGFVQRARLQSRW